MTQCLEFNLTLCYNSSSGLSIKDVHSQEGEGFVQCRQRERDFSDADVFLLQGNYCGSARTRRDGGSFLQYVIMDDALLLVKQ